MRKILKTLKIATVLCLAVFTSKNSFAITDTHTPLGNFSDSKYFVKERKLGYLKVYSHCEMQFALMYAGRMYENSHKVCKNKECYINQDKVFRSDVFINLAQSSMVEACKEQEEVEQKAKEASILKAKEIINLV